MNKSRKEKIERHRAFLEREKTDRPLVGLIRGWENLSRYVSDTETFFPKGNVAIGDISCDRFITMYQNYVNMIDDADDLFVTLEPLPFFPWTEAAMGCPVRYTGKNFWASPIEQIMANNEYEKWDEVIFDENVPDSGEIDFEKTGEVLDLSGIPEKSKQWIAKYGEFLDSLCQNFAGNYPIGQSILRGPLDMAAAVFGDENMVYLFYDQPSLMKRFLTVATKIFLSFIEVQKDKTPAFEGGYVIGSYYIWTPGTCLRLQEDAMSLLSPELYRKFVHPCDCLIASAAEYSLFHLHSTGLHLLDFLLENEGIRIFQVSKDEGVDLETILPGLRKIQEADRCLIVKGRLNGEDLQVIKKELDFRGLCVQAVVSTPNESETFLSTFF